MTDKKTPHKKQPHRIFAIANQKGGVGKTTTAVNLATSLAALDQKVLLIDADPQGNASTGFGIPQEKRTVGLYRVLIDEVPLEEAVVQTEIPNLSVATANVNLAGAEIELVQTKGREYRLREAILGAKSYDYVLIDCPPALGLLTINALASADAVIVPLQAEFYALEGLSHLLRSIDLVQRSLNPSLTLEGVVLTMFDSRNNLSQLVQEDVRSYLGEKVFKTVIPRNVRVSEAPSHGKPVLLYDWKCPGAQGYIHLASELLTRQGLKPKPIRRNMKPL